MNGESGKSTEEDDVKGVGRGESGIQTGMRLTELVPETT